MTNQDWVQRRGIFLHYPGVADTDQIAATLPKLDLKPQWGAIKSMVTTELIALNFIPFHLREGCESWLLLYLHDVPNEVLILPFTTFELRLTLRNEADISAYTLDLLTIIANTERTWNPSTGFRNLKHNLQPSAKRDWLHPYPEHFELARLVKPFQEYLQPPPIPNLSVTSQAGTLALQRLTEHIQKYRFALLEALLDDNKSREQAIEDFESSVLQESAQIAEEITQHYHFAEVIPPIVHQFIDILDEQTKRFLITAETLAQYAKQHQPPHFDYAAAGCGLWKAVEREFNLSFIWHLRRRRGIAGEDPLKVMMGEDPTPVKINGVDLSSEDKEHPGDYKGIMLGQLITLLEQPKRNGIMAEVQGVLGNKASHLLLDTSKQGLSTLLKELKPIRNHYAHIAAMPPEQYEILRFLALNRNDGEMALLEKVLRIKRSIHHFWSSQTNVK